MFPERGSVGLIGDELLDGAGGGEHLVGAGAYAQVFGEILPAYGAGAVYQKLRGTGDVMTIGPRRGVQQTVTPDYIQIGVGQEREGEARFAAQVGGDVRRVHADGYRANLVPLEFLKVRLDAS